MDFKTPIKVKKLPQKIEIPASPFMKKIGYGTGVAVYELNRSPLFNRMRSPWAVKKLLRGRRRHHELVNKRLINEAEILRKLDHPNIVGFRAATQDKDGQCVLAMEECSTSLGDMIEKRDENLEGPFESNIILKVAKDVSLALKYLHEECRLLHCDIKSYNVLIKGNFTICKLCDFGVSLPLNDDGILDESKLINGPKFEGTLPWYAPELFNFPQVISDKGDIYAFGLVIWEMIALAPPVCREMIDGFNESTDSVDNMSLRQRPDLPDHIELGEEYNDVLEIYICCTVEDHKKRPNANAICQALLVIN